MLMMCTFAWLSVTSRCKLYFREFSTHTFYVKHLPFAIIHCNILIYVKLY